jgi:hypothetical protein
MEMTSPEKIAFQKEYKPGGGGCPGLLCYFRNMGIKVKISRQLAAGLGKSERAWKLKKGASERFVETSGCRPSEKSGSGFSQPGQPAVRFNRRNNGLG